MILLTRHLIADGFALAAAGLLAFAAVPRPRTPRWVAHLLARGRGQQT